MNRRLGVFLHLKRGVTIPNRIHNFYARIERFVDTTSRRIFYPPLPAFHGTILCVTRGSKRLNSYPLNYHRH